MDVLLSEVSKDEVRKALNSMKSLKSPCPDGFQPFLFKKFWEVVGDDVWRLVHNAFIRGWFDDRVGETLIALIPKINQPTSIKQFRPISLCNVTYKFITKVLVNRLRPFLSDIVGHLQSSFIPGRGTTDNIILAQEVIHYMHKSHSKNGVLVFKIDLEKAYNIINWGFWNIPWKNLVFQLLLLSLSCIVFRLLGYLCFGVVTSSPL